MQIVVSNRADRMALPIGVRSLIVDGDPSRQIWVEELLGSFGYNTALCCASLDELVSALPKMDKGPKLVVLCTDKVNESLIKQLERFTATHSLPVLMLSQDTSPTSTKSALKAGVTGYMVVGVEGNRIKQAIETTLAQYEVITGLKAEISSLKNLLNDRIIIEKAKGLIMKNKHLNEDQAFRYLREYSMKKGLKMVKVAEMIIDAAEIFDASS